MKEIEYQTWSNFDPEEAEFFFKKRGWPVTFLKPTKTNLVAVSVGAPLMCSDGRSDNCHEDHNENGLEGEHIHGPRVFGGINAVMAMLTEGDDEGLRYASRLVRELGSAPGTHSDAHEGCGYYKLWINGELKSAPFPYEIDTDEKIKSHGTIGSWLREFMHLNGGRHYRLNGQHIEEAVRLNPYNNLTECAHDCMRFRVDDWFLAKLGVPNRQRYSKVEESVRLLRPQARKLEIIHPALF